MRRRWCWVQRYRRKAISPIEKLKRRTNSKRSSVFRPSESHWRMGPDQNRCAELHLGSCANGAPQEFAVLYSPRFATVETPQSRLRSRTNLPTWASVLLQLRRASPDQMVVDSKRHQ